MPPSEPPRPSSDSAREGRRGLALITAAKAYFMLTGFAQPIVLTHLLGAAGYGTWGTILNAVSIFNNVAVAGSIQGMSRAVTEHGRSALRPGLALHVLLGVVLGGGFALSAGIVGGGVLADPSLVPLLRVAAIVLADYCLYAALVGVLNGQRRFGAQAGLDMLFATLRTGFILVGAATSWRAMGAITGFALASMVITLVALIAVLARPPGSGIRDVPHATGVIVSGYLRFIAPVFAYHLLLNLVLQSDLLVLKAVLGRRPELATAAVDRLAGIYKSVQNLAFLPYQLLLAVTFVAFPLVSSATLRGDRETAERFVHGALRFSVLVLGAAVSVLASVPRGLLRTLYRPEMAPGEGALAVLSAGTAALALLSITCTILLAAGRTRTTLAIMLATAAACVTGDLVGVLVSGSGTSVLVGLATGTATACGIGLVLAGGAARRWVGAFVAPRTFLTTGVALAVSLVVGRTLASVLALGTGQGFGMRGRILTAGVSACVTLVYVAVLWALGERWLRPRKTA